MTGRAAASPNPNRADLAAGSIDRAAPGAGPAATIALLAECKARAALPRELAASLTEASPSSKRNKHDTESRHVLGLANVKPREHFVIFP
jgi:hypothetical protein